MTTKTKNADLAPGTLLEVARAGHSIGSASASGQLMLELGVETDHVSLTITNPGIAYADWELVGKQLGLYANAAQWWIGDWMDAGETLFGQEAAQAADTIDTRHDLEHRVTGLDPGYLANIRSVCSRVARAQRRPELSFSHHQEVTSFEPAEQTRWLKLAIKNRWNRNQLREAIRESRQVGPDGSTEGGGGGGGPTIRERVEQVARDIYYSAEAAQDDPGKRLIADELYHRLGAALGEE